MKQPKEKKQPRSNSRDKSGLPRRVFAFGCKRPDLEFETELRHQAYMANDVQAAMVKIEMAARLAREAVVADNVPEYRDARDRARAITEQIDALYDGLKTRRAHSRTRESVPELESQIKILKTQRAAAWLEASSAKKPFLASLKPHWDELKRRKLQILTDSGETSSRAKGEAQREALRQMRDTDVPLSWVALAEIGERSNAEHCAVRRKDWRPAELTDRGRDVWGASTLDNDTKELAREAFLQAAAKTAAEGGRMREPRGAEGRVGRMWDASDAPVVAEDGTIRSLELVLEPQSLDMPDHRDPVSKRSALRKRMLVTLRIAGQQLSARVLVHRPLPKGGVVRRAWFMLKPMGVIELQLVVQYPEAAQRPVGKRHECVAVQVGWAKEADNPDGRDHASLVVARWLGSDGRSGTIELQAYTQHSLSDAEELRGHQDDHRNEATEAFKAYVESGADVPPWLREAMRYSASWRNGKHLSAIAFRLRDLIPDREPLWKEWVAACKERHADLFPDVGILDRWLAARGMADPMVRWATVLEWWRRKDRHLRLWEQNQRNTAQLRRRDFYRVQAARLASEYDELVLLEANLKAAARKTEPEQKIEGPERLVTKQRRQACPSELIAALGNAFRVKPKAARFSAPGLNEALRRRGFEAPKEAA